MNGLTKYLLAALCGLVIVTIGFPGSDPGASLVTAALADDDDGGGDDDDDDGGAFQKLKRPAQVKARPQPRRRAILQPLPDHARAEIIGHGLEDSAIDRLIAAGYVILEQAPLASSGQVIHRLRVPERLTLAEARAQILSAAPQAEIDFNHYYRPDMSEDCVASQCLARNLIGWNPSRQEDTCSRGIRIGMIDTAINEDHEALAGSRIEVQRFVAERLPPSGMQHGTAIAALLVGNPSGRSPGLLPGAELVAVDTFHRRGRHDDVSDAYSLVKALDYLESRTIAIINLSLTGPANVVLERAIERLAGKGVVLVAAAGNDGPKAKPVYPAAYPQVVAVTAVDRQKRPYRRAARGSHIDLAAPGVDVWIAASQKGARPRTGTSFAAPFVTAAIALAQKAEGGVAKTAALSRLTGSAEDLGRPGHDDIFGWGLLNPTGLCG
ncbi:S8 family serine peptidase [Taklimakanibacter deserti]|uniref:S8 family serine peptidase n=1 Tax=Taklimakanibacter deserti TaxID=2267839 RepID=UPI000E649C8D